MEKTFTKEIEEEAYEVEFMTLVVDKKDNMKIVDSDNHFSDFTGVHPSKIKQGKIFLNDIVKPADRERIIQAICKKNNRFVYIDFDIFDKNHEPVFVRCTAQNTQGTNYCELTLADVSKSRAKQQKLRERATEMNELIDLVNGGVSLFKVTSDMHIEALYLNKGCCRFFGTSKESCRQRVYRLDELIYPVDRSQVFQAIGKTMAVGTPIDMECRIRVHKNEFMWCNINAGIQRYDEDNCPIFHAIFTDITRIKNAEKKADEESERLVRLFKNLPGAVFFTDAATPFKLDLVSEDFVNFIGYTRMEVFEIFGGNLKKFIENEDTEALEQKMTEAAENESTFSLKYAISVGSSDPIMVRDSRKIICHDDGTKAMVGVLTPC